jgi:murein L,D-transpeptidase YcbB/YkuD
VALFLEGQHNADASQKAAAASAQAAAAATKAETATLRAQAATVKAQTATAEAVRAKQLTKALARERYRSILENCRGQNKRYYNTRRGLYRVIKLLPPSQRPRARASIRYSLTIIGDLQPPQHCKALANK